MKERAMTAKKKGRKINNSQSAKQAPKAKAPNSETERTGCGQSKKREAEIARAELFLERARDFISSVLSTAGALVVVLDVQGRIVNFNRECERVTGYTLDDVRGRPFWDMLLVPEEMQQVRAVFETLRSGNFPNTHENHWISRDGTRRLISWANTALLDSEGKVEFIIGTGVDVTERRRAEGELKIALDESRQREKEVAALLNASRAVLKYDNYADAAAVIFDSCKEVIGAASGYIALVRHDGSQNEVMYIDSGGLPCTVDPALPMPIRGMRGEVMRIGQTIYTNDFPRSEWVAFLPQGHVQLENVLMSPMILESRVVGLFGLGNKPGGFNDNDVRLASAFSDLAAIALVRKRAEEKMREAKEALQRANDELEKKVAERTEDLMAAYEIVFNERKRLFTVLDQIPGYVCILTTDHHFTYVNLEFIRRFGNPKEQSCFEFFHKRQQPCPSCRAFEIFSGQESLQWEWTSHDGKTYAIIDYPFSDIDGSSRILELGIDITERKKAEEELSASREKLRHLYAHLQSAVEAERKNIARELHDEFGTILTALNIDLTWLEKKLPEDQLSLRERINKDVELIGEAIKIVQRISSELRPGVLDYLGFPSAVEWLVKEFGQRTGIAWDISIDAGSAHLSKDRSIGLFRIIQETLTNIARHAAASKISVSVREIDGILTIEVADNGRGIREENLTGPEAFGVLGMKERAEYLGGEIEIRGFPGTGTKVTVRVPIIDEGSGK